MMIIRYLRQHVGSRSNAFATPLTNAHEGVHRSSGEGASEHTSSGEDASEHMAEKSAQADLNTPLQELVGASASFGQWTLKISGPPIEKTYTFDQGRKTGKAFTVIFVSKDSTQYCAGRFTRRGTKADAEKKYDEAKAKVKANIVWKVTNVQLVKHEKPL